MCTGYINVTQSRLQLSTGLKIFFSCSAISSMNVGHYPGADHFIACWPKAFRCSLSFLLDRKRFCFFNADSYLFCVVPMTAKITKVRWSEILSTRNCVLILYLLLINYHYFSLLCIQGESTLSAGDNYSINQSLEAFCRVRE